MGGPTYKITWLTGSFMLATALVLDAIQVFLTLVVFTAPLSELSTFIALPLFGIWYLLFGVNPFGGKHATSKVISSLGSAAIELVPFLDALPGITIGVWGVIWATRKEDEEKFKEQRAAAKKQAELEAQRLRVTNDNERRRAEAA